MLFNEFVGPVPDGTLFITNEQFTQQVEMMEGAGFRLRFRIEDPKATGRFLAYAEAKTER